MRLHLTPSAVAELQRIQKAQAATLGFRLYVKAGGCAGLTYTLELATEIPPSDEKIELEGLTFFVPSAQVSLLDGLEIDYPTGLAARGFVFHNPQARRTCGCGSSFSI
ncbi:MAG: iron-sulfur cluster assembly accessory protein [Bacteroidia bacterium]|nr:iron-sulfur cluster assembly accessory protein [Bacteroidia bacterium]MDW8089050.1 iron-sulfur cluster assembly accessory protein [Bacteroidia bacterium]